MYLLRFKNDEKTFYNIKKIFLKYKKKPILIHTDIARSFFLKNKNFSKSIFLKNHWKLIFSLLKKKNLLVPCFNYDFTKNKKYSVQNDKSQVGHLNEFFRKNFSNWRSEMPVFSICGASITKPSWINIKQNIIDPFDNNSVFNYLYKKKGACFFYGAKLSSATIIHYVERLTGLPGLPFYRFDKYFKGEVTDNKRKKIKVLLKYHVRPQDIHFAYDFKKLSLDLKKNNIGWFSSNSNRNFIILPVYELVNFWLKKIKKNPLYFLDLKTKKLIQKKLLIKN